MKTRAAFYLLIITCVTLILINFDLNNKLHQVSNKEAALFYRFALFYRLENLKENHDLILQEIKRLEDENKILGSIAAQNELYETSK